MTTLSGARHEANIIIRGHKSTGETPIHENRSAGLSAWHG